MTRELAILIGRLSGIIVALAYIPQEVRIFKLKSSRDVSIWMYMTMLISVIGYEVYALTVNEPVMIFANTLALIQVLIMIFLIVRYRNER
jgi:MtN3 and saliva related transmembrane protein